LQTGLLNVRQYERLRKAEPKPEPVAQANWSGFFAETMNETLELPVRKTNPWPESAGCI
jgi:hypothetical protein